MQSSPSPPSEKSYSIKEPGYFSTSTISTSGRQRTAQACDKCRERKTKCSGEKPVCQRCTNRGLICEYSYREPRVRARSRVTMMASTTSSPTGDLPYLVPTQSSRQDIDYSRSHVSHRNHQTTEYHHSTHSVASRHHNASSPYLGAEPRSYSEPRAVQLPRWAHVRHGSGSNRSHTSSSMGFCNSPQVQISVTATEANGMGYVPYSTLRQPTKRQEALLSCVPNSSSFLLEAQQNHRYNTNDLHYDYCADNTMLECPVSSSPVGNRNGYQSSSTVSSSTTPPPFYPLDHLEHSTHSRSMTDEYHGKRDIYAEEDNTGLIPDFSYTKDLGIRDDWCIDSDSFSMGEGDVPRGGGRNGQNTKLLGALWSNEVPQVELEFSCQTA